MKNIFGTGSVTQEHLHSKSEALISNSSTTKRKTKNPPYFMYRVLWVVGSGRN
jgi:hypothetical protein